MHNNPDRINSSLGKNSILITILFSIGATILMFQSQFKNSSFPLSWEIQFYIIITLFTLSALILFVATPKGIPLIVFLGFQFIFKYLLSKPFNDFIWLEFFLIIVLLLEGVLLLGITESLILTSVIILTSLVTSHDELYWGVYLEDRPWILKLTLLFLTMFFSGLCIMFKSIYMQLIKNREIIIDQTQTIRKLSIANAGFQQYANLAEEKSINSERMRITREIHDTVGYTMTNLLMMLEASTDLVGVDPDKLEKLLNQALEIIKDGHKEMRHSLRALRDTKVKKTNTIESIRHIAQVFNDSTGIEIKVELGNLPWDVGERIEHIILRFLQEGMTNSLTHGDAKIIDIHFWLNEDRICINLKDDGLGCADINEGIGLKGMEERLAEVGGVLTYQNIYNGFSVKAEIPWDSNE